MCAAKVIASGNSPESASHTSYQTRKEAAIALLSAPAPALIADLARPILKTKGDKDINLPGFSFDTALSFSEVHENVQKTLKALSEEAGKQKAALSSHDNGWDPFSLPTSRNLYAQAIKRAETSIPLDIITTRKATLKVRYKPSRAQYEEAHRIIKVADVADRLISVLGSQGILGNNSIPISVLEITILFLA